MASKKISGTQHVKKNMKRRTRVAIGTVALICILSTFGILGANGKLGKIASVKEVVKTFSEKEDDTAAKLILGGDDGIQTAIMVSPLASEGGTISGTGSVAVSNAQSEPGDSASKFIDVVATANSDYKIVSWTVYDSSEKVLANIMAENSNLLRVYYYADAYKSGESVINGVNSYVTNQNISVKANYSPKLMAGVGDSNRRDVQVITSPNVGEMYFWIWTDPGKLGYKFVGRSGYLYSYYVHDAYTVGLYTELTDGEKNLFDNKDDPRFDTYLYDTSGQRLKTWMNQDYKNLLGGDNTTLDPGQYIFVAVPHLKTGYDDHVAVCVEPYSAWGDATWNGSQVIATPSEGYMFDHWEWYAQNQHHTSTDNPMAARPSGVVLYTAYFKEAQYKVDVSDITPTGSCTVSGTGTFKKGKDAKITVKPNPGYSFNDASWTTEDGIHHNAEDVSIAADGTATFTVKNVTEDIYLTINMDSNKLSVTVKGNPSTLGSQTIENKTKSTGKKNEKEDFTPGDKAELIAIPTSGNIFLYWEDSNGNRYPKSTLTIDQVYASETFTAHYAPSSLKFKIENIPTGASVKVWYTDKDGNKKAGEEFTSDQEIEIETNSSVTLQADEEIVTGGVTKKFANFTCTTDTTVYNDNPHTVASIVKDLTYEVNYVDDNYEIQVITNPSGASGCDAWFEVGGVNKGNKVEVNHGQEVTLKAKVGSGYEFLYFMDQNKNKLNSETSFTFNTLNGPETFTAVFAPSEVVVTTVTADSSKGDVNITYTDKDGNYQTGEGAGPVTIKGGTAVTLTGVPKPGCRLVEFYDNATTPNSYPVPSGSNSVTIPDVAVDTEFTAVFEVTKHNITVNLSPFDGGSVNIKDTTDPLVEGEGSLNVTTGHNVSIVPTPDTTNGYRFLYLKDTLDNKYVLKSGTIDFANVQEDMTFTAYFVKGDYKLSIDIQERSDAGYVETEYVKSSTGKIVTVEDLLIEDIQSGTTVNLKAIPKAGYTFDSFIDQESGSSLGASSSLTITPFDKDRHIIAKFLPKVCTITAQANPEMGGNVTVNGKPGSDSGVKYGSTVTIIARPNTPAYTFVYFQDQNGNKYNGTPVGKDNRKLEFKAVNGDETYTAVFVKKSVNVTIDLTPSGSGVVRFNDEAYVSSRRTYTADGQGNVRLAADPKENYKFLYWKDQDGNTFADNPLSVVDITKDLTFTAVFESEIVGIRAVADPASGGTIEKTINDDGSITLNAVANPGYKFANWEKPNGVTLASRFTIPTADVHEGDIYTAHFNKDASYDARSDITKENFYREWREVSTPHYTVTRDSMQLYAMQTVAGLRQYNNSTPGLRHYNAVDNARAYFDERTAKDAARLDGVFGTSELMAVEGEVLTPDLLPDQKVYDEIANEFTLDKFGKKYDTEILTVKRIYQPTDFDNLKRTYLWRYTGAEYKDNIYLLYNMTGQKEKWATPIVDEDGILKFTIDDLPNNDVVAVVRVKLK